LFFPGARSRFAAAYNPKDVESNWYKRWEKQGYFLPNTAATAKPFSMVLPPPNVTGNLHLGHALTCTIQDVLARW
jgi:valyl-tRNA synthetase